MVPSSPARRPAPRSLADDLRARDDAALADLLAARPDLAVPLPPDLTTLAAAAAGRLSVQRAVDGLDTPALQVLEVLAALPEPATTAEVGRRWGAPAAGPLETLRALGLVWGTPRALRLVRAARDALGPYPAGLGPPLADALDRRSPQRLADLLDDLGLPPSGDPVAALTRLTEHLGDAGTVRDLLKDAPDGTAGLLDRLTWGPPVGRLSEADRPVRAASAGSPAEWLLARGLLAVADAGHVVLPREVALVLRGGRVHERAETAPPRLPARARPARQVDGTAAGAAAEAVRLVEDLGRLWGGESGRQSGGPPPVLRAGGLGVRDLRRTAQALEVDDATAALVVELAYAAGLVADDGEADPGWLPTTAFDGWADGSTGERWADLVAAWWSMPRAPGLVGERDAKDAPIAALGPEAERPLAVEVRQRVVAELLAMTADGDGRPALAADPEGRDAVVALLDWWSPRRAGRLRARLAHWTLREAAWLGLTGAGAPSAAAIALLAPGEPDLEAGADALDDALPEPVDHVLLQADLTAVAPGPLEAALARELGLAAEVESRGGATVYRFGAQSVRRALDAGRTGDDLLRMLAEHSRTPVPQPLEYLVTDTARRYGRLRVGSASAYLRAEDPAVLDELLAERRAAPLRLRRLAPTVLAAQAAPEAVLKLLREIGLAPAAESAEGELLVRRPDARRAAGRVRRARPWPPPVPARADLLSAVSRLRLADERGPEPTGTSGAPPEVVPMDPAGALALLRDAAAASRPVWVAYLEDADRPSRSLVRPLSVEAGRVRAQDVPTGRVRSFSVHRVIGVAPGPRG